MALGIGVEHRAQGGMVVLSTHTDIATPGGEELHLDEFAPYADGEEAGDEDHEEEGAVP